MAGYYVTIVGATGSSEALVNSCAFSAFCLNVQTACPFQIFINSYQTEPFLLPTDAHNVKKRRVIKTYSVR